MPVPIEYEICTVVAVIYNTILQEGLCKYADFRDRIPYYFSILYLLPYRLTVLEWRDGLWTFVLTPPTVHFHQDVPNGHSSFKLIPFFSSLRRFPFSLHLYISVHYFPSPVKHCKQTSNNNKINTHRPHHRRVVNQAKNTCIRIPILVRRWMPNRFWIVIKSGGLAPRL